MMTPAMAQLSVYPANDQSPEQQQTDETECQQWAVQQTGINPAAAPPVAQAAAPPTTATGTTAGRRPAANRLLQQGSCRLPRRPRLLGQVAGDGFNPASQELPYPVLPFWSWRAILPVFQNTSAGRPG